ncbi:carbohydrate-binding domain-containing protein [Labilibacter marinus]|uniref:carbohydrate-binding domain-containing protein n=1 Tax=Labilibacter marinus TaxID=1477105 RepID=UPI00117A142A|nr:carbohydrate-binding domain-containing protein [Labilibacter marinus]
MSKYFLSKKIYIPVGIVLFIILSYFISGSFLSYNKPINSSYLLLEDWASYAVAEDAQNYFVENNIDSIFIIGMKYPDSTVSLQELNTARKLKKRENTYSMYWSGILGFEISSEKLKDPSVLSIKMRGSIGDNTYPHYNIYANKTLIGSGFVNEKDSVYKFNISNKIDDPLSHVLIYFDNDHLTSTGDRNLYVSERYIDSINIDSIATDNFFIIKAEPFNFKFISNLRSVKCYLNDLGIDSARVRLVETPYCPINKTLAMAKGAKEYFNKTDIQNLNIITATEHSSRTYLNFKNCLQENMEVGCIPSEKSIQNKKSFYSGIDERISLTLTWMYWWFN